MPNCNRLLGDIIVAVDKQKVKTIDESIRALEIYEIGQSIMPDVRRND